MYISHVVKSCYSQMGGLSQSQISHVQSFCPLVWAVKPGESDTDMLFGPFFPWKVTWSRKITSSIMLRYRMSTERLREIK